MKRKEGKRFGFEVVGDENIEVFMMPDGRFHVTYKDHELYSETLTGVLEAVKRKQRVKKTKVAIPATYLHHSHSFGAKGPTLIDVEITGIHGRTNEVLFRDIATGHSDRVRAWSSEKFFRRMTDVEKKKYFELDDAADKARAAFETYKKDRQIEAERLVTARIKEIENGVEEAETDDGRGKRGRKQAS